MTKPRRRKMIRKIRRAARRPLPGEGPLWRRLLRSRRFWGAVAVLLVLAVAGVVWVFRPYWRVVGQFSTSARSIPSRIYESPPRLARGQRLSAAHLTELLDERGYRASSRDPLPVGSYRRSGESLRVHLRSFPTVKGWTVPLRLEFSFRGSRLAVLELLDEPGNRDAEVAAETIEAAWLDPRLIRSFLAADGGDRWPLRVDELPDHVVRAVLAAEDDGFFEHQGVSPRSIVRAFLSNLDGEGVPQGGSTLTQQLVKNLYLSPERKLSRKIREAFLALYIELRYTKEEILEAYLNEIYLGRRGGANLMGIGSASRAFFGVPPDELDLSQAAVLAGMIQAPANIAPDRHPEEAKRRRDWVLGRLTKLGWIGEEERDRALAREIVTRRFRSGGSARYAADAIVEELAERFDLGDLGSGGFTIVATLDGGQQAAAERALREGLESLTGRVRPNGEAPLQAALVSADPEHGAIRAWVGGRDYGESQFDRVRQARRQVGSAFKPVVLAAAFSERSARLSDRLVDEPLTMELNGKRWSPRNSDDDFRGEVTVREAVEDSLNVPSVRLALDVGLERIVAWGRRMGVESPLEPLPSLALGAFEMTPLELLGIYATLANGGLRPPLHLVEGVLDRRGEPVPGEPLPEPERVLEEEVAFLVTSVLEGVVERGTGRGLRTLGVRGAVAAKSGTTNARRDAWFAGYTPSAAAVVWVGYDDPAATGLSGASGALPIFGEFVEAVRPDGGYGVFRQPPGVTTRTIDPLTGELATERCPEIVVESYLSDDVPSDTCWLHDERERRRRGFWRRLFGRDSRDSP